MGKAKQKQLKEKGSIRRYMEFVKPYKKQILLTVFVGIIKFSIPLGLPLLYKYIIDNLLDNRRRFPSRSAVKSWPI